MTNLPPEIHLQTDNAISQPQKKQVKLMKNFRFINSRLIYTVLSAFIIILGSYVAIRYAQGDFRVTKEGILRESGLLAANSFPPGAQVYVNDKLVTATDDTIYLEPDVYEVKISKDGYSPWHKTLTINKELVTQTNAQLFPAAPSITPLTFTGATKLIPAPDGRKIVYYSNGTSTDNKKGIYLLDLTDGTIFQKSAKQIAEADFAETDIENLNFIWAPDSSQIMVIMPDRQVLIETNDKVDLATLPDVSFKQKQILSEWEEEMYLRERQYLEEFPEEVIQVATQSAKNVYLSPDKKRLLYTATASATIPEDIVPPVPSRNTQPEERSLQPGGIYVYDREEDKNFKVAEEAGQAGRQKALLAQDLYRDNPLTLNSSPSAFTTLQATSAAQTASHFNVYHSSLFINTLQWFSDSKHLIFIKDEAIQIMEYDSTNHTTLYSGPFMDDFVYPWPDGSRVLILTKFSPDTPANLYAIELE